VEMRGLGDVMEGASRREYSVTSIGCRARRLIW
jgi:hypothetical protein